MRQEFKSNRPKKSLGQSFLKDKRIIDRIIGACSISVGDAVLEIGPGHGELTRRLISQAGRVSAVELDTGLYRMLKESLGSCENLELINKDILKFDIGRHFKGQDTKIRVIGNIPYYITSPIIEHLFSCRGMIKDIFLTVQKEFARRLVSPPGSREYGSFSCFAQYYSSPEILFYIKRGSFSPAPKVDSAFLRLKIRNEPPVKVSDEELFFKIIRTAFSQRRKKLSNSIKNIASWPQLELFFSRYGIDNRARPEVLSLQDFANLANIINA